MTEQAGSPPSLLDVARPRLREGIVWRDVGGGALAVGLASKGRYARLALRARDLLPLLDGTRTLGEVMELRWSLGDQVGHQTILDTVSALHVAGLLEPLGAEVEDFLAGERGGRDRRASRWTGLLAWAWAVPVRLSGRPSAPGRRLLTVAMGLGFLFGLVGLVFLVSGGGARGSGGTFLGPRPVESALWMLVGGVAALSVRQWISALGLLAFGRWVGGVGLGGHGPLPYLYVDLRDRALLHQHEAAWFHGWALASVVSTAGAGILAAEWLGWTGGFFLAVGAGLVALAMVCPFVSSDLAMILEGVTGVPGLARRTRSFLMNRVLRSLFATQRPEKAEAVILVTSALSFVYLFGAGLVLFRLALHMVDLGIWAVTGGQASWWESVLASLVVLGVWGGFLGVLMALLVTTLRTLFQASRPVEKAALPRRSTPEQGISLDGLAQELAVLPPFNALPPELVVNTVSSARMEHYRAGDWILRQGDAGSTCYVLRKGHCRAFVRDGAGEDVPVGDLGPGSLFGEVALLDSRPRTASVRATEDTEVMVIDGPRFIALVEEGHLDAEDVKTRIRFHGQLKSHAVFQWMAASSLAMLLQAAVIRRMSDGTVVLSEGEQGDTLYLIHSGDCRVSGSSLKTPVVLTAGDLFGEMVVFRHAMARTATVTSQGDSVLVEIPGEVARKSFAREFSAGVLLDRTMQQRMEGNAPPEAGRVTP